MAQKIRADRLIDNVTPEQKEALLNIEANRYNLLAEMAETKWKYDTERARQRKALDKIEAEWTALIEMIESGQTGLPFDGAGKVCGTCEGTGKDPDDKRRKCSTCDGRGTVA